MTDAEPQRLEPGVRLVGGSRTITDAEIAFLPALMGAINPLFHDEEAARKTGMGTRILFGPALIGIAVAATEPLLRGSVLGLVGLTDVRFRRPVTSGDTVTATMEIVSCEPRVGKPGAILEALDEVHNQNGELVLSFRRRILVRT